jgi:hypothetical protein
VQVKALRWADPPSKELYQIPERFEKLAENSPVNAKADNGLKTKCSNSNIDAVGKNICTIRRIINRHLKDSTDHSFILT